MKLEYVNKATGEVIDLKAKFNKETDKATLTSTNLDLNMKEVVSLRKTTNLLTGLQITAGIATGLALGKGLFTTACIIIGSSIIFDMITPTDLIYNKVLTFKAKKQ